MYMFLTYSCLLPFVTVSSKVVAGGLHFIDAPGGTGKTYLLTCLIAKWRSQGNIVLCVAPSGLAATLMEDGRTVHGRFRVPVVGLNPDSVCNISAQSDLGKLIKRADAIIIDKAPNLDVWVFDAVSKTCIDLREDRLRR